MLLFKFNIYVKYKYYVYQPYIGKQLFKNTNNELTVF